MGLALFFVPVLIYIHIYMCRFLYINIKNSSGFVGTVAGMKENNRDGSRVSSQG